MFTGSLTKLASYLGAGQGLAKEIGQVAGSSLTGAAIGAGGTAAYNAAFDGDKSIWKGAMMGAGVFGARRFLKNTVPSMASKNLPGQAKELYSKMQGKGLFSKGNQYAGGFSKDAYSYLNKKGWDWYKNMDKRNVGRLTRGIGGAGVGAILGAGGGAAYGAFSNRDSMFSGAFKGAVLGAMAGGLYKVYGGTLNRKFTNIKGAMGGSTTKGGGAPARPFKTYDSSNDLYRTRSNMGRNYSNVNPSHPANQKTAYNARRAANPARVWPS